jgi:hypothetical protein
VLDETSRMIRTLMAVLAFSSALACTHQRAEQNKSDAAAELERIRDRTNPGAPATANDHAPINKAIDQANEAQQEKKP